MSEHLSEELLNTLVDDELLSEQSAEIAAHLAECPACTTATLSQMMLKSRTAQAGRRYELPSQMSSQMRALSPARDSRYSPKTRPVWVGWTAAIAAALIVVVGMGAVERRAAQKVEDAALVTELTDQHVSAMAVGAPPEVLSSDRHTVKPWFQGKIPFSFNLPEGLPGDTTLDGANLAYLGHRPVAQLLYSIGKHRVSVFVRESEGSGKDAAHENSGFHVRDVHTGELEIVAVSDVDPARLDGLVAAIRGAQTRE